MDIGRGPTRPVVVDRVGDLPEPRALANSVVLPNGNVLVTGGQVRALPFSDAGSVFVPALWSARSGTFRDLAPAAIPRNYHSWSLLLADGRVLTGGGGLCGDCETNHPDVEIFTPPYLLEPDGSRRARPRITGGVPASVRTGSAITVTTNRPVRSWALMRTGSSTHSINSDQRRIGLTAHLLERRKHTYRVQIPADRGATVPGSYLLFAMDRRGTPSPGVWLRVP